MVNQKFRYASTLGQDHLGQRRRNFTFMGPHNNFFRKKSPYLNNLSLDHKDKENPKRKYGHVADKSGPVVHGPKLSCPDQM